MNRAPGECGMGCLAFPENKRDIKCIQCSQAIAQSDLSAVNQYKSNIIEASREKCFDAALLAAFISRQTRGGVELDGTDGWIDCHNNPSQRCYGIMHMPECKFIVYTL